MFFGGMCDADGIYYYYLIAVIALGALVSLAGLAIMSVELSRAERRKACFYFIRRRDRLDADVEFIDLDKKIALRFASSQIKAHSDCFGERRCYLP